MKKNRNVILTLLTIFVLFPFSIISTIAIDDPDYTETIPPGQAFVIGGNLNEGETVRIEYHVISGGNKDVDFYIKNSNEVKVIDRGRVIGYGLYHFNVPYDDYFSIVFSNTFSTITSKVIEIKIDIVKTITLISPESTDILIEGYNYIYWTSTGDIDYVTIDLYKDGAYLESLGWTDNDGSYSWYIYPDEYFGLIAFEKSFSYGFDYNPPPPYSGVLSVEHIELTLTGTSNSSQLTKNQNITNCIPFVTMQQQAVEGDIWDNSMCDIFFTDTDHPTVHAERIGTGGLIILSIYIIEFDGISIKVQSGSFSSSEDYANLTINEVDLLYAVPMAYYKIEDGDDGWDCAMVTTDFINNTAICIERDEGTGTMSGHYYIFEAQNKEFYVQKAVLSMFFLEEYNFVAIEPIDMEKTFIISSYKVDVSNDDTEEGAVDVWLNSATEVGAKRNPAANNFAIPTINVFVVTFREMCNVQRGVLTWEPDDTSRQQDITEVNQDLSMIKSGQMYGIANCDGIEDHDTQSAFFEHLFIDNNTIQLERYTTSQSAEIHWEVIEFGSIRL